MSTAMPYRHLHLAAVIGPVVVALAVTAPLSPAAEPAAGPITVAQSSLDDLESVLREAEDRAQQLIDRQTDAGEAARLRQELADTQARLEQASDELAAADARARELQGELEATRTQAGERDGLLAGARQEIEELRDRLEVAPDAAEIQELRDELQAAHQRIEQLTAARADAEARLREETAGAGAEQPDAADARSAELRRELETAWSWIEELNQALAAADAGREAAEAELAQVREAAAQAEAAGDGPDAGTHELEAAEARIAELEAELENARASRSRAEEELLRARDDAERRVAQIESALEESTARAERMGEQYQALQARVEQLNAVLTQVRAERGSGPVPGGGDGEAPSGAEVSLALAQEVAPPPDRSSADGADTTAALVTPSGDPTAAVRLRELTTRTVSAASARRYLSDLGAEERQEGLTITVPGDLFQVNSAAISDEADGVLWKVAAVLAYYNDRPVRIVGHTDSLGDPGYNQTLSERRASAIRDYFVERFAIDGGRLTAEGVGEARPVAANDSPGGRQQNRRVEVVIQN